jgi:hypothetical protein
MAGNSVINLRIGQVDLRNELVIKTPLGGCSTCQAVASASNPLVLNIANCDVNVTIEMRVAKNWNSSSPWRKLWSTGCSYKTKGVVSGGLKKGIALNTDGLTPQWDSAKDQLKTWFQTTSGETLDDGAAEDIINQLFKQAQEKETEIIESVKKTMDSSTSDGGPYGYLPHANNSFNEKFREMSAFLDFDSSVNIETVSVKVNICISPTIATFCKDDTGKGKIETKQSTFCGYANVEWPDDGAWQVYINDYAIAPKSNVNSNYFANTAWTQYDEVFPGSSFQSTAVYGQILQAAYDSYDNPGFLYTVNGGFEANINGFYKVKIITDLGEDPQPRMTASLGLDIGGGIGSDYHQRPFIEGLTSVLNLGSPGSIPGNVQGLATFANQLVNPISQSYNDFGEAIDQVLQSVGITPDGTAGNTVPNLGGGSGTPSRIGDGQIPGSSTSSTTGGRVNPPGTQTTPTNPRAR